VCAISESFAFPLNFSSYKRSQLLKQFWFAFNARCSYFFGDFFVIFFLVLRFCSHRIVAQENEKVSREDGTEEEEDEAAVMSFPIMMPSYITTRSL
jgi:hypothetical protein